MFSQWGPALGFWEFGPEAIRSISSVVAEAILYNSLEVLVAMFYKMKKVTLQEENEAYLQKGAQRSSNNKRRKTESWRCPRCWWGSFWSHVPILWLHLRGPCLLAAGTVGGFEVLVFLLLSSTSLCTEWEHSRNLSPSPNWMMPIMLEERISLPWVKNSANTDHLPTMSKAKIHFTTSHKASLLSPREGQVSGSYHHPTPR